jgi:hypothetical protein
MNGLEINSISGEDYFSKRTYIAQNGSFAQIVDFRNLDYKGSTGESELLKEKDPQELDDWDLFLLLRWRFKSANYNNSGDTYVRDINALLGMHPDAPCAKCKWANEDGSPDLICGSLRCHCRARREKIAAEAKANARRMWEENHGAWPTYEEFLDAMPGIDRDVFVASEYIGREQYWEGEPCEYFEPIEEA